MPDWSDIAYLQLGTARQRQAYAALLKLGILTTLQAYHPVLAGTIPLDIDLPESDLDIICEVPQPAWGAFQELLRCCYGQLPGFALSKSTFQGLPTIVSCFRAEGFVWEVFAQPQPVSQQNAVRHLTVEHAVLEAGGETWRAAVRQLKQQGLKTEPAFARLLGLPGDPYLSLLMLEGLSPQQLRALLRGRLPTKE